MSHFHRRQILQSGVVALANFVIARVRNAFLTAEDREKILFRNVERLLANAGAKPQRKA